MNELKALHTLERQKFWAFTVGLTFKLSGYLLLFFIDWRIGLGVMLIDKGGELLWKGVSS